jgi:hypothetical protein
VTRAVLVAAGVAALAGCAGGEHRPDSTGASTAVRTPAPTLADPGTTSGAAAGASSGATAASLPRDSVANTGRGPGGRPTPLPMPQPDSGRPPDGAAAPQGERDTLRGIVAVVGSVPMTEVVLRTATRGTVRLVGAAAGALRRLSGVELMVRGRAADGPRAAFEVAGFAVRAVDGVPARDGTLVEERGSWFLVTADGGRHRLAAPPDALREQVGARVWVAGAAEGSVASFGVITPKG